MIPSRISTSCAMVALSLLAACGGGHSGSTPAPATALVYTDPADQSGLYLKVEPATNHTSRIVLDLMAGSALQAQGVSLYLSVDPAGAGWTRGDAAPFYASNGTTFDLGEASPQAFAAKVRGGDLQVGLYQQSGTVAAQAGAPLVRVGLTLGASGVAAGTSVALGATPGTTPVYVDASGAVRPFPAPIAIGTLTAN
jgi:hypothetical protein